MSNPTWEDEPENEHELEIGGSLQEPGDQQSYALESARVHGELKWGEVSARGGVDGPAVLAPLAILVAAMIAGGIIWAASTIWQAGASVMVGSLLAYGIYVFSIQKRKGRG